MASTVAQMPSDEWRNHHPSRLHIRTHKPFAKILTSISTSIDPSAAAASAVVGVEHLSPVTAAKRQQSQILDRWVTRQAREIITTLERQAYEDELSALSTMTQPVSARAASFLRETSPDSSVSASVAAVGWGGVVAADIPQTMRASSLIQIWREMEADAKVCPTPCATRTDTPPAEEAEETSDGSDACDEAKAFCEWENAAASSSASSSSAKSEITEKRKVGDIVRMLNLQILSSTTSSSDESDLTAKEITGNAPTTTLLPSPAPSPTRETSRKMLRVRGRREIEDFILKLKAERRRDVAALAERYPVSRFPFRGRIQSLIRLRSLRQEVATIRHQQCSQKLEAERFKTLSNNFFLRQRSEDNSQHDINEVPNEESIIVKEVQPLDSDVYAFASSIDLSDSKNNNLSELVSTREIESSPQTFYTPQVFFSSLSRYDDLQESQSSDASWDERSLWGSSLDWQRPSYSHMLQTWRGEFVPEGMETSTQDQNSCRGWGVIRRSFYNDLQNTNFIESREIQELLIMKPVSTSLASEFSSKMNQMIASFLHRQGIQHIDGNGREEHEEQHILRPNYESNFDQEGSATSMTQLFSAMLQNQEPRPSISLPLPSQILQNHFCLQSSLSTDSSSPSVQEKEDILDLKYNIAQINYEIYEIRKLVESYLDWQKNLEISIKQEVFSVVNQLAERGNILHNSKHMQVRNDTCCICCEARVDALLYRCGHMCACYKCAQGLQLSSGRCPICRSVIADVIRAHQNP